MHQVYFISKYKALILVIVSNDLHWTVGHFLRRLANSPPETIRKREFKCMCWSCNVVRAPEFNPKGFSRYQLILYQDINTVLKMCLNAVEVLSF